MKKSLILASLLLASSSVMASEYFVGADLVKANSSLKGSYTINGTSGSASDSDSDTVVNFKFGMVDNNNRYYVKTGYLYEDTYIDYYSTTLNYERLLEPVNGYTPFIGAHFGRGTLEILGAETTGNEYGVQAGALTNLENGEFEFGFRYSNASAKFSVTSGSDSATVEAESGTALYVGYNYKF